MYLCGSPCISVCVSLGLWVLRSGAQSAGLMEAEEGPPVSSPDPAIISSGVELDSRRDGHAIEQSDSTDPYSRRAVVSSGRAFDRHGPLYYDYMKNYDIPATCYFTLFSLSRTLTVRDKYSYRNH